MGNLDAKVLPGSSDGPHKCIHLNVRFTTPASVKAFYILCKAFFLRFGKINHSEDPLISAWAVTIWSEAIAGLLVTFSHSNIVRLEGHIIHTLQKKNATNIYYYINNKHRAHRVQWSSPNYIQFVEQPPLVPRELFG